MYKHLESVHMFFFVGHYQKSLKKILIFKLNCSLLHALASVQEVRGFTQNYHVTL